MNPDSPPDDPNPPTFDRETARRRYRATMRGPFMRSMTIVLALVLLAAWGLGIASVLAKDVEGLPDHDLAVRPSRCVACHAQGLAGAPPMPHVAFPTCGFCHRQSPASNR